jgi:hypothetical protein
MWFSNNVEIPGKISLPNDMRSVQLNVTGQPEDVYATSPWRAPGFAPVFGSGCGLAGGANETYLNGGAITGYPQGMDGLKLPKVGQPEVWKIGGTAEVAWYSRHRVARTQRADCSPDPRPPPPPHPAPPPFAATSARLCSPSRAISANHGGGYSYRLCPADGTVNEACFQVDATTRSAYATQSLCIVPLTLRRRPLPPPPPSRPTT